MNYILLKEWLLFNFVVGVTTYLIILTFGKKCYPYTFCYVFGILTACHGYRYFVKK